MKKWCDYEADVGKIRPSTKRRARMDQEIKMAVETVRDPTSYSFVTYGWVFILSLFGCVVRVLREVQSSRKSLRKIVAHFIVELLTSGFAGLTTFFLCEASDVKPMYSAALISIAGWMGVRALTVIESIYMHWRYGK